MQAKNGDLKLKQKKEQNSICFNKEDAPEALAS